MIGKQRKPRILFTPPGGDDPDLGRYPGRPAFDRKGIEGFGDDLRREASHREQDTTRPFFVTLKVRRHVCS
jgi:hypothetical protein